MTQDSVTQASEEAMKLAAELSDQKCPHLEYGGVSGRVRVRLWANKCDLCVALLLDRVSRQALERAAGAILDACSMCDGLGYVETVGSAHAPGCDGGCRNCPVPVRDREGCEYCGRPMAAVRALIPGEK